MFTSDYGFMFSLVSGFLTYIVISLVKNKDDEFQKKTWNPFFLDWCITALFFYLPLIMYFLVIKVEISCYTIFQKGLVFFVTDIFFLVFLFLVFLRLTLRRRLEKAGYEMRLVLHKIIGENIRKGS